MSRMARKSVFGRLKGSSATEGRNDFWNNTGEYEDEILRIRAGETQDGDPFFAIDGKIIEVIASRVLPTKVLLFNEDAKPDKRIPEGPSKEGDKGTFYVKIANPFISNKLGNVRNACEAIFDSIEVDYDEWDEIQWEAIILGVDPDEKGKDAKKMRAWLRKQFFGTTKPNDKISEEELEAAEGGIGGGDGTLLAGLHLIRSTEARVNKVKDGVYCVSTFSPAGEADDGDGDGDNGDEE